MVIVIKCKGITIFFKKLMVRTITGETKREGQRKVKRHTFRQAPNKKGDI